MAHGSTSLSKGSPDFEGFEDTLYGKRNPVPYSFTDCLYCDRIQRVQMLTLRALPSSWMVVLWTLANHRLFVRRFEWLTL